MAPVSLMSRDLAKLVTTAEHEASAKIHAAEETHPSCHSEKVESLHPPCVLLLSDLPQHVSHVSSALTIHSASDAEVQHCPAHPLLTGDVVCRQGLPDVLWKIQVEEAIAEVLATILCTCNSSIKDNLLVNAAHPQAVFALLHVLMLSSSKGTAMYWTSVSCLCYCHTMDCTSKQGERRHTHQDTPHRSTFSA